MKILIEDILSSIPTDDGIFRAALSSASAHEIKTSIAMMKSRTKNKTRIAICDRELKKRKKALRMLTARELYRAQGFKDDVN